MKRTAEKPQPEPAATPPRSPKAFAGIKRVEVKILKPGTVDSTETLRRMRGR
jgi:hypothetical protein